MPTMLHEPSLTEDDRDACRKLMAHFRVETTWHTIRRPRFRRPVVYLGLPGGKLAMSIPVPASHKLPFGNVYCLQCGETVEAGVFAPGPLQGVLRRPHVCA